MARRAGGIFRRQPGALAALVGPAIRGAAAYRTDRTDRTDQYDPTRHLASGLFFLPPAKEARAGSPPAQGFVLPAQTSDLLFL